MPPVKKVTRISRANGANAKARHEAAKSMEQLTAAHATLTVAHATVTVELLSSRELYNQLREQQAFQQHARGADYSNTSAKEATRFTREQLRAYLLYHKVPPRDQPVGNTLVAGWQKAVQKHIAERGSPTGHGVLP
ncbi:hypothetical protein QJQ45_009891 [Haematococcus lacustris]|nr:hypothetical protein QJQ45_009891 [Haematococcus lacustris]